MFILKLTYIQPIEIVEKYLELHITYLNQHYASGHFIASGRQVPRTGGIILCRAKSKEEIYQVMQNDPFFTHKIAQYEVIEFIPTKYENGFHAFI